MAAAHRCRHWPELVGLAGGVLTGWVLTEIALLDQPEAPTVAELVYLTLAAGRLAIGAAARWQTRHRIRGGGHAGPPRQNHRRAS